MKMLLNICSIIGLIGAVYGATNEYVTTLDANNFDEFIGKHEYVLVKFYAPWCRHCKEMAPAYEEAGKILFEKESKVKLGDVDATANQELAQTYDVKGYPTLFLFRNKKPEEYTGGRSALDIVSWIEKMTGPDVYQITSIEEIGTIPAYHTYFVGTFKSEASDMYHVYKTIASKSRQMGTFYSIIDQNKNESLTSMRNHEDPFSLNELNETNIEQFISSEHIPLYAPINAENYRMYFEKVISLVWVCGEPSVFDMTAETIRKVSRMFRNSYAFVFLNIDLFKGHAEGNLDIHEFPAIVIHGAEGRYIMRHSATNSEKLDDEVNDYNKIVNFIQNVQDKKIKRSFKSEDVPVDSGHPVKIVVGNTFEDIVYNSGKDVMLEVYAPWCGHCKQFEPIYNEIADKFKDDQSVIIAKMDGTLNESPVDEFQWRGFPSIFFIKAGERVPKIYQGHRSLQDIVSYIETNKTQTIPSTVPSEEL